MFYLKVVGCEICILSKVFLISLYPDLVITDVEITSVNA